MNRKTALLGGLYAVVVAVLLGFGSWFFLLAHTFVKMGSYIAVGYFVLGVACFLSTGILLAFPLARVFSLPFGSLFFPNERFDRPQPPYSRAEAALKQGDPQRAITIYRELAEEYPEEVRPYIGLMDIAAHELRDVGLTRQFYREGMGRLQDMDSQQVLNKMYRANMSRLSEPPTWGKGKTVRLDPGSQR